MHLKFNLELESIATHALFLVRENKLERLPLNALLSQVLDPNILTSEGKLLFKSWIVDPFGSFERSVFQDNSTIKQPNTSVWLKTMEESYMSMLGKYIFTDEESIMLGCLKMQVFQNKKTFFSR